MLHTPMPHAPRPRARPHTPSDQGSTCSRRSLRSSLNNFSFASEPQCNDQMYYFPFINNLRRVKSRRSAGTLVLKAWKHQKISWMSVVKSTMFPHLMPLFKNTSMASSPKSLGASWKFLTPGEGHLHFLIKQKKTSECVVMGWDGRRLMQILAV